MAPLVKEALTGNRIRTGCVRCDAELLQCPYGVGGEVDSGADRLPLGHPFDDFGGKTPLIRSAGQGETGNAGTDDQDA